jgi:hypothetical protein
MADVRSRAAVVIMLVASQMAGASGSSAAAGLVAAPRCDIDGDGYGDLPVGIPGADGDRAAERGSGAVLVIPGSPGGPATRRSQLFTQDVVGIPDANEVGDRFGATIACGDIDGDGFSDLVVGVPGEKIAGIAGAGAVHVLYGSATGVDVDHARRWHVAMPAISGEAQRGASFGSALAVADVDGDGFGDVLVGSPGAAGGGSVHVLFGAASGLTAHDVRIRAASVKAPGSELRRLGAAVAAGDVDGDGLAEVVAGAPGTAVSGVARAGAFSIVDLSGRRVGTTRVVHADVAGIRGAALRDGRLGSSLDVADIDGDGRADIAAGAPGYRSGGEAGAGAVLVLYGSRRPSASRDLLVRPSVPARDAGFGWSVATGDVDGDGRPELVVGAPAADGAAPYSGVVELRSGAGLEISDVVTGTAVGDQFGVGVAADDFTGDGIADVAMSAPRADAGTVTAAGSVFVGFGSAAGLSAGRSIDRTTRGVPGGPGEDEGFGAVDGVDSPRRLPAGTFRLLPRVSWTGRDPVKRLLHRHEIAEITIHHFGGATSATGTPRFRSAQSWHMDGLGWGDIAYHYIVGKDGLVYEARPAPFAGDTSTNYDPDGHLLVVVEGNFDEEQPTAAQLDALVHVVAWSSEEWEVSLDDVSAHRDHAATACPGANLYPFIASGELVAAAAELIDGGGVWAVPE